MALGETSAAPVNHIEKTIIRSTLGVEGSFLGRSVYPEWAGTRILIWRRNKTAVGGGGKAYGVKSRKKEKQRKTNDPQGKECLNGFKSLRTSLSNPSTV